MPPDGGGVALGGRVAPGLVVDPGVDGAPLFGEFGDGGAAVPGLLAEGVLGEVPGVAVPGVGVAVPGFGAAVPGVGVAVLGCGVAVPGFVLFWEPLEVLT